MVRPLAFAVPCLLALTGAVAAQTPDSGIDPVPLAAPGPVGGGVAPAGPVVRAASFQRRSGQSAGGPANELNTGDARASEALPAGDVVAMASGRDLYHGNYCGPGERGAGLPATDALDEACRRHDACYDAAGSRDCTCDTALRTEVAALAENASLSRILRARAASVAESTAFMGCTRR